MKARCFVTGLGSIKWPGSSNRQAILAMPVVLVPVRKGSKLLAGGGRDYLLCSEYFKDLVHSDLLEMLERGFPCPGKLAILFAFIYRIETTFLPCHLLSSLGLEFVKS